MPSVFSISASLRHPISKLFPHSSSSSCHGPFPLKPLSSPAIGYATVLWQPDRLTTCKCSSQGEGWRLFGVAKLNDGDTFFTWRKHYFLRQQSSQFWNMTQQNSGHDLVQESLYQSTREWTARWSGHWFVLWHWGTRPVERTCHWLNMELWAILGNWDNFGKNFWRT